MEEVKEALQFSSLTTALALGSPEVPLSPEMACWAWWWCCWCWWWWG